MAAPRFQAQSTSFHADLKQRVNDYFIQNKISQNGNALLYSKAIILLTSLVGLYVHLVFFTPPTVIALLECLALGAVTAAIGFNVMHDGAHGSFSKSKKLNQWAGLSLNFLGASVFMWETKHNLIHHTYTNIDEHDDDIDAKPFLRLCQTQRHYKIHNYQHFYFWFTYAMLYIYWVFFSDYQKYFTKKIGDFPIKKMKTKNHLSFWGFKLIHIGLFVVIPVAVVGFLPWLVGFLAYSMFTGIVISVVFQLAHTCEENQFPVVQQPSNRVEDEWAIHQLKTTANFATKNKIVSWFTGGLNFQIEHHLFPLISHVHYPNISTIVKQTCQEYGIPYIEFPKTRLAIASHVSHLKNLSRPN